MSDTDDGFDKEAARRELREKYEAEREDRETTARMSELLLQGATMTNKHCDRCGSPIFRYDGQEFCPTCQHEAEQGAAGASDAEQPTDATDATDRPAAETSGAPDADQSPAGESEPRDVDATTGEADAAADANPAEHASRRVRAPPSQSDDEQFAGRQSHADRGTESPDLPDTIEEGDDAAEALSAAISTLARRAASADDPRRAKEFMEAAREAADALDALR